ncbi:molybdopterin converting factor subunit 1 [Undibacterium sp. SXout7W]|uniref:molybdopterin converting factor subunit 1 n=1 Tax=Undibacterium sp. SXout7W TaxID=3413049 RepID=UPI003BEF9B98
MNIQLRFFASVREKLGVTELIVSVPEQIQTVGALRQWLTGRGEVWAEVLAEGRALRTACQQQMCDADTQLREGVEVAFFPPVTGG